MTKVLVVCAHADDEAIGCGGTIAWHHQRGDDVHLMVFTDGVGARTAINSSEVIERDSSLARSSEILGIQQIQRLNLPDNQLDTLPLLTIVKHIESKLETFPAEYIYTHFPDDLNIDHQVVSNAVLTACRPQPDFSVKMLAYFEVRSSTEWASSCTRTGFRPNHFVDIETTWITKQQALCCYKQELHEPPHSRSIEAIHQQAKLRGAQVGLNLAEAFMIERMIIK